jgi:hypothetical protein
LKLSQLAESTRKIYSGKKRRLKKPKKGQNLVNPFAAAFGLNKKKGKRGGVILRDPAKEAVIGNEKLGLFRRITTVHRRKFKSGEIEPFSF